MVMQQWAVVADGHVDNVVVWDGETDWQPGDGTVLVPLADGDTVSPGWVYDGATFTRSDEPVTAESVAVAVDPAVIADLVAQAQKATTVTATRNVLTALLQQLQP